MRIPGLARQHDPERDGARYLVGGRGRRWRQRFERHLLECEACWSEVRSARRGWVLAERARELAPPELRESIRVGVALPAEGPHPRRGRLFSAVALGVVAALTAFALTEFGSRTQPPPIRAALAAYRSEAPPPGATSRPAPDLSAAGLRLESSGRVEVLAADAFRFVAPDGGRVLVLLSDRSFPEAVGATERTGPARGWRAAEDEVTMVCADWPVSYLVLSDAPGLAEWAEVALRIQGAPVR